MISKHCRKSRNKLMLSRCACKRSKDRKRLRRTKGYRTLPSRRKGLRSFVKIKKLRNLRRSRLNDRS